MADYDSDSSGANDIETNVLLGYAAKSPTGDDFSQLGGHPTWMDGVTTPSGNLVKCKTCNELMSLLLQLHGDIPERFPGHERRLYLWTCRRKACRRKEGSIRGFRGIRVTAATSEPQRSAEKPSSVQPKSATSASPFSSTNLGDALFGAKSTSTATANPFATPSFNVTSAANPFAAASSLAAKPPQPPESPCEHSLPETFAQKVKISTPSTEQGSSTSDISMTPQEPWPASSSFPDPFPRYHVDADKEYLDADPQEIPSNARLDPNAMDAESSSAGGGGENMKDVFESSMDKTFQRFADRLSQNPEQILRYEFGGQPLLYAKSDKTGRLLALADENAKVQTSVSRDPAALPKVPRCENCGAGRVFELQLTPHAITELEADDLSLEGMDWGTIILAVCAKDCYAKGTKSGDVGYSEEWVGAQWEEVESRKN